MLSEDDIDQHIVLGLTKRRRQREFHSCVDALKDADDDHRLVARFNAAERIEDGRLVEVTPSVTGDAGRDDQVARSNL